MLFRMIVLFVVLFVSSPAFGSNVFDAAMKGNAREVARICEDVQIEMKILDRCLLVAATNNHAAAVRVLLEEGTDPHFITISGQTILQEVVRLGNDNVLDVFIEYGVDMNKPAPFTKMKLVHIAAENGNDSTIKRLLQAGAEIDAKTYKEETAIYLAAKNGCLETVKVLLEFKADYSSRADSGMSPSEIARTNGHQKVVEILEEETEVPLKQRTSEFEFGVQGDQITCN